VEQTLTLRRGAQRFLFIGGWGNGRLRVWFGSGLGFGLVTHCCRWVELVGLRAKYNREGAVTHIEEAG